MKSASIAILLAFFSLGLLAQDTEFPREFIMHLNLQSGIVTSFNNAPELYTGGVQVVPQYTFITNLMRGGVIADVFYTSKNLQGAIGPTFSIKLTTLTAGEFGSIGNINLSFDHLWGTGSQRLLGGGINLDLANRFVLGVSVQRDYNLGSWWMQTSLGFKISKTKKLPKI
jgi:hypothetical protein